MSLREITRSEFLTACPEVQLVSQSPAIKFYVSEPYYGVVEVGQGRSGYYVFRCVDGIGRLMAAEDNVPDPKHAMRGKMQELQIIDATNEMGYR